MEAETIEIDNELEAIKKIGDQVEGFKKLLGEKADASTFEDLGKEVKSLSENFKEWTDKEVLKSIESINAKNESIHKQIMEMQEKLAEERDGAKNTSKKGELISAKAIKEFVDAVFPEGKGNGKSNEQKQIEIKAAETFGGAVTFPDGTNVGAITGQYVVPGLFQPKRKTNLIIDYIRPQTINVPTLIYLRKLDVGTGTAPDNGAGGAAWINCGEEKPKRSFRITTGTAEAKKLAIFGTIEDCLLQDVPSFERWMREDFLEQMREEYNNGLLNNNPLTNAKAPLGLKNNASSFVATPAFDETIINPNYIDSIIAAAAFMAENRETPQYAFVSMDVFYAIHNLKGTNEHWLNNNLVYVNNLGQLFIAGVQVVGVDSEDVGSGYLLMTAVDLGFKIYNYGNLVFERGLNGDDFREDKTSYRAYQRVISFIPEDREASVLYDTWANIQSQIAAPEEVVE